MLAIETKFHGPTNTKGARVSARMHGMAKRVEIPWDHALSVTTNHQRAALYLLEKLDLFGRYIGGTTKTGMVFVYDLGEHDINSISRR